MSDNSLFAKTVAWLKTEPQRLQKAFSCSIEGLKDAFYTQAAFRLEALITAPLVWWVIHQRMPTPKKGVLVAVVLLVLVVELVNSALEITLDRVSTEIHPLTKRAKDMASAAVLMAIVNAVFVWWLLL